MQMKRGEKNRKCNLTFKLTICSSDFDAEICGENADVALLGHHALLLVGGHGGVERVLAVDVAAVHRRARVAVDSVRRHHCGRLYNTHTIVIFNSQNKSIL